MVFKRNERIQKEVIEPKDKIIEQLYYDNKQLHKELQRQVNIIDFAEKLEKEYNTEFQKMQDKFSNKEYELKKELNRKYDNILDENKYLRKIINSLKKQ